MSELQRITSIKFSHYKAFKEFSVSLNEFNVLVGPNNAGKSTILSAFRILAEGLRKAKTKSPTMLQGPNGLVRGYEINLENLPIATENIFYNYEDDEPARIEFRISNGEHLLLYFPKLGVCHLICDTSGKPITTSVAFKSTFNIQIGIVPTLGPVEHNEQLFQVRAAEEALLTHRASRNFRNIWYHFPEKFNDFKQLIKESWPGMDINKPEMVMHSGEKPLLKMFCPEERIDREIYWAGFGFQVWCQMLTYMVMNREASILIIDEPDIYLHSDLQRQLVNILRSLGPDILIATHSPEIISQTEIDEILLVTKKAKSAKRVKDLSQLESIFKILGSNLNPVLTQLARTKKVVFVEGKDFLIFSRFANKLGVRSVAMRSEFAVVPTEGFNPQKAKSFAEGVQATISSTISSAVIFDRDYKSESEVETELSDLNKFCEFAHIHHKKELENFLLVPNALSNAINHRIKESSIRSGTQPELFEGIDDLLESITNSMKSDVQAQLLTRQLPVAKRIKQSYDNTTLISEILSNFDISWNSLETRLDLVSGKELLSKLNTHIQKDFGVTITPTLIIEMMTIEEIPLEMKKLIESLERFALS